MGLCKDKYVTFLNGFGYNVVRLPRAGISPLMLMGRQGGTTALLGDVAKLITQSDRARPDVQVDLDAAPLKGQASSSIDLGLGLNVMSAFIGALGGNVGVKAAYKGASAVTFRFDDIVADRTLPLDVGEFLKKGTVDADNPILEQYVLGNGDLFILTETLKSNSFTISATKKDGTDFALDVPAIKGIAGGSMTVSAGSDSASTITYAGKNRIVFGFACFHVGVEDGKLTLMAHKPSESMALALAAPANQADGRVLVGTGGMMNLG